MQNEICILEWRMLLVSVFDMSNHRQCLAAYIIPSVKTILHVVIQRNSTPAAHFASWIRLFYFLNSFN
jgi:hypothetical protein